MALSLAGFRTPLNGCARGVGRFLVGAQPRDTPWGPRPCSLVPVLEPCADLQELIRDLPEERALTSAGPAS